MNESPCTGDTLLSTTHTSPSGVVSTRGTRSRSFTGASRSQRSGGGFTCESAEIRRPVMPRVNTLGRRATSRQGRGTQPPSAPHVPTTTRGLLPYPPPHPREEPVGGHRE